VHELSKLNTMDLSSQTVDVGVDIAFLFQEKLRNYEKNIVR
jgi:hypothetical protein